MFVNSFSVENQMETKFRCAGCHILQGGQVLNGEKLPFELFLYAEKGQFRLFINSETVICPPLGTVLIPCDTAFRLETDGGCELIFIGADYRIYTSFRIFSLFYLPILMSDSDAIGKHCFLIRQTVLDSEFTNSRLENAVSVNAALYQLAEKVLCHASPSPWAGEGRILDRLERLSPVFAYIEKRLDGSISVEKLAELTDMSGDAFYRLFKETVGISPKEYLISERLRRARLLLLTNGSLSVGEIAHLCGYESPFSFSSLFHENFGCPPSIYRAHVSIF